MKYELSMKDGISPRPMKSAKFSDSHPRIISPSFEMPTVSLGRTPGSLNNKTPSAAVCSYAVELTASSNSYEYNSSHNVPFNYDLG